MNGEQAVNAMDSQAVGTLLNISIAKMKTRGSARRLKMADKHLIVAGSLPNFCAQHRAKR
jgi:hypothetical protein